MQVIIVGNGFGVGFAVAHLFGRKGYKIGLISNDEDALRKKTDELQKLGITSMYAVADVRDTERLLDAYGEICEVFGYPAMALYCEKNGETKKVFEYDWESIEESLRVNVGGAYNLSKEILPHYIVENRGKLFFLGNYLAQEPQPKSLAVGLSSAALRNMVYALSQTVANTNVQVAMLTLKGAVQETDHKYNPLVIAEQFWTLFSQQPGGYDIEKEF